MDRRQALALALSAAFASPAPAAEGTVDAIWTDSARQRELPLRLRWPAGSPPATGWPVILFSHGLGGSRAGAATWGEAWSQAGFIVVHLQHPGSDTPALRQALAAGKLREASGPRQVLDRLGDVRFVLDEIGRRHVSGQGPWRGARPTACGMSGHSFGAHTTLGMAGQRYPGAAATVDEPRLAAYVAFSPTLPGWGDPREAYAGIRRPLLAITGTQDEDVVGNGATPDRRAAVFDALPAGAKAQLVLQEADHMTFGGTPGGALPWRRRNADATRLEVQHHALVARISTDWWRAHLAGDGEARARLQAPAGLAAGDRWQAG